MVGNRQGSLFFLDLDPLNLYGYDLWRLEAFIQPFFLPPLAPHLVNWIGFKATVVILDITFDLCNAIVINVLQQKKQLMKNILLCPDPFVL